MIYPQSQIIFSHTHRQWNAAAIVVFVVVVVVVAAAAVLPDSEHDLCEQQNEQALNWTQQRERARKNEETEQVAQSRAARQKYLIQGANGFPSLAYWPF